MSIFAGLETARKGLMVSQKAIEVTGHNIANANTPGYARQRLSTVSIDNSGGLNRLASVGTALVGGGAAIITVDQIRSPFLDRQYRQESSLLSEWRTRADNLAYIESLFDELSDTGISEALKQFSTSIQELSKNPAANENRTYVIQNAISLSETLRHFSVQLSEKQHEQDQTVQTITSQINTITRSISDLNTRIAFSEMSGQKANDLRDQRNTMLDDLSGLISYTAHENDKGQLQIMLGDDLLVSHQHVRELATEKNIDNPLDGQLAALNSVVWADGSGTVEIASGSLKATMDIRDGDTSSRVGLPFLSHQLDRLTVAIADTFNTVHQNGWTLPDPANGLLSAPGAAFFISGTDSEGNALPMRAATITVNPAIIENLTLVAASDVPVDSTALYGNNRNALELSAIFTRRDLPDIGSLSGFINSFISTIAVACDHANNRTDNQNILVSSLEQQRASVMGVSLDEETTSLIRFQHSYAAAARVITTIDEMLDVLINRTGMVGR